MHRGWPLLGLLVTGLLQAGPAFDPVRDVAVTLSAGQVVVGVPQGAHLKVRSFRIVLVSGGTLKVGALPPATGQDEDGEPLWRGTVRINLSGRGLEDPVRLSITYQPCTEGPDGVCCLPVKRVITASASEVPAETP